MADMRTGSADFRWFFDTPKIYTRAQTPCAHFGALELPESAVLSHQITNVYYSCRTWDYIRTWSPDDVKVPSFQGARAQYDKQGVPGTYHRRGD